MNKAAMGKEHEVEAVYVIILNILHQDFIRKISRFLGVALDESMPLGDVQKTISILLNQGKEVVVKERHAPDESGEKLFILIPACVADKHEDLKIMESTVFAHHLVSDDDFVLNEDVQRVMQEAFVTLYHFCRIPVKLEVMLINNRNKEGGS